jgi:hypothetical protein
LFAEPLHSNFLRANNIGNAVLLLLRACCGPFFTESLPSNGSIRHKFLPVIWSSFWFILLKYIRNISYKFSSPIIIGSFSDTAHEVDVNMCGIYSRSLLYVRKFV